MFLRLGIKAGDDQPGEPFFFSHVIYNDEQGAEVEQEYPVSLAPDDVRALEQTDRSIRMGAQLINVIDVLKQFASRSTDETLAWMTVDALRSEVDSIGGRADSLLRELVLVYQAIEIARGGR